MPVPENLLKTIKFKCKYFTSSVLNKDTKQYGKNYMFDDEEDTSWNSDQGTPQWIAMQFDEPLTLSDFKIQFQGGFVGKDSTVKIDDCDKNCLYNESFYADDINSLQCFKLKEVIKNVHRIKFTFNSSSDFFGRIIIYKLQLF